jgi:hypothetical protein
MEKPAVSQQEANPHFRLALCSRAESGNTVMPRNKCNRRSVQKHARKASLRAHSRKCDLRGYYAQYIVPFSSPYMQYGRRHADNSQQGHAACAGHGQLSTQLAVRAAAGASSYRYRYRTRETDVHTCCNLKAEWRGAAETTSKNKTKKIYAQAWKSTDS